MKSASPLLVALCLMVLPARAVVVASGASLNTAPIGQPYFHNVGSVNGASAIYLGGGWVLTAHHVAGSLPSSATFGGNTYTTTSGSFNRLTNPAGLGFSTYTDMVLFQLSSLPPLPAPSISDSTPTVGSQVMMIGNGRTQNPAPTYWDRTSFPGANNDLWVETSPSLANFAGYKTSSTQEVRWGENVVDENLFSVNIGTNLIPVDVIGFSTAFDANGLTNEAQAVSGDSGGGVFRLVGGSWELAGMMFAVATFENQPGGANSAVLGNLTAISDLSFYRDQIYAIIPEPSVLPLAMLGLLTLSRRRGR